MNIKRLINLINTFSPMQKIQFFGIALYILVISTWTIWEFFRTGMFFFSDTFSLNMVEGLSLYFSEQILHGASIYTPINFPPYTLNLYPPLYPVLSAGLLYIFSPYVGHIEILRAFTLAAECLTAIIGAGIVYSKTRDVFVSAAMVPVILGFWSIHTFHGIARIDFIALAFSLLALFSYIQSLKSRSVIFRISFIIAALCAVLVKQTSGLVFLTCLLHTLFVVRKTEFRLFKLSLVGHISVMVLYGIVTVILIYATGGEYIRQNFTYQFLFSFDNPRKYIITTFLETYGFILLLFAVCAVRYFDSLLFWYVVLSFCWVIISIGKSGADHNYVLELAAALLLYVGVSLGTLRKSVPTISYVLLCAVLVSQSAYTVLTREFWYQDKFREPAYSERKFISKMISDSNGLILSVDPLPILQYQKQTVTYDPFMVSVLLNSRNFHADSLLELLQNGSIEWVYSSKFFAQTPVIQAMLRDRYELVYVSRDIVVHEFWKVYRKKRSI